MARGLKFGFGKKRDCTISVAKTKALMSFAVTAKLICFFVFANAKRWFSYDVAHVCLFKALRPCYQFFSNFGTASWV